MVKAAKKRNHASDLIERKLLLTDPWYKLILEIMKSVDENVVGKRVLEVGCGFGGFCIKMAGQGADVIGLDISLRAIREALDFARQTGFRSRISFVIGDANFLPFRDQSCEVLVCSETLEHIENYEQAFDELVRTTEKGGHLYVTLPNLLSTLFFECVLSLSIGQPGYVKEFFSVEKEHVFHIFKANTLFNRQELKIERIQVADLFHLSLVIRKFLRRNISLRVPTFFKNNGLEKLFGANIGILARKK